jgi:hypothetical protein
MTLHHKEKEWSGVQYTMTAVILTLPIPSWSSHGHVSTLHSCPTISLSALAPDSNCSPTAAASRSADVTW